MTSTPNLNDDVRYQLGAISGKLDLILVQSAEADRRHTARMGEIEARVDDHDTRLDSLERNRSWVLGAAATVTAAFGAAATILGLRA